MTTLDHYFWNSIDEKAKSLVFKNIPNSLTEPLYKAQKMSRPVILDK